MEDIRMAIRNYIDKITGQPRYEVYVHLRSEIDPRIRIQKYKKCKTLSEAQRVEKILIQVATKALCDEENRGSRWNVVVKKWNEEALRLYRNPVTLKTITDKSINTAMCILNVWTKDWMDRPCKELTIKDGKDLLLNCVGEDLKVSTIHKIKTTINLVFRYGVQEGIIKDVLHSPVHGVMFDLSEKDTDVEILTVSEIQKLLVEAKARKHPWYAVWAVALMTGMRSSELFALRKENVLLPEGFIRIKESWDWFKDSAKSTKAGYWRTAPIAKAIRPIIAELMQADPESPFLFPRHEEWLRSEQAIVLRRFCEEIGIRSVRFHTLRACFATHMLATGVDQATVMAIGGWSNLKTFRIYVRLAGITERSKTERLGDLFVPAHTTLEEHISKTFETTQEAA
ncbi:MAG: hypothetical protein B7Y39_02530 [Bdellovibrio sp. 28-41-41]|nr:MAG: hypothetical protein B7Y39_02530 [Bdellovibrio sp. 28-41-41]